MHALVAKTLVRDRRADPLVARGIAERALATTSLEPANLAPPAVLIVRRLDDPLPGALGRRRGDVGPPRAWQDAVRGRLEDEVRAAARPALGPVPAQANAVLFADRAELLACFARDVAAGVAAARWWWTALRVTAGAASPVGALAVVLRREPTVVPAVFELLARSGDAVAVARALAPADAEAVVLAVARAFGLHAVARSATEDLRPAALLVPRASTALRRAVPEAHDPGLEEASRALLVVALGLRRALPALRRLATPPARDPTTRQPPRRDTPVGPPPSDAEPAPPRASTSSEPSAEHASIVADALPGQDSAARKRPRGNSPAETADAPPTRAAPQPPLPEPKRDRRAQPRGRPPDASDRPLPAPERSTVTQLGGVFYLLNVALELELYGDFTRPRDRAISLDPWLLLSEVAARLLGGRSRDPVWELLDELVLERRKPRARRVWRPPRRWLAPFTEDRRTWRVRSAGARLRVEHPAGFPVLDVVSADHASELARLHGPALRRVPGAPRPFDWLDALADYARAALCRRLDDGGALTLLRQRAEVRVGAATVDVAFALDEHPIEIRIAGLDRDPGFVPAAGRTVSFHYR